MKIEKIGKVGHLESINDGPGEEGKTQDYNEDNFNRLMPEEFLKKMPGINSNNIKQITKNVKNMVELVEMDEAQLRDLITLKNAKLVKSFLETKVAAKWEEDAV